jgi:parvulin-like peptidyl-prolyl isomerase
MKKTMLLVLLSVALVFIGVSCGKKGEESQKPPEPEEAVQPVEEEIQSPPAGEPERITVQHILIAFEGSIPEASVTRTQEEARTLAYDLLDKIKEGGDFDNLVEEYTDDAYPGIYSMSNIGIDPDPEAEEYARQRMVPAFGNVGFTLEVGEVGIADYDPDTSKYGWHIIKRIK